MKHQDTRLSLVFAPRVFLVVALLSEFVLAPTSARAQFPWKLVWSDEFNGAAGSQPNPANWIYQTGTQAGGEVYCAYGSSTSPCVASSPNVYLDGNGHLVIAAQQPSSGVYTSAEVESQGLQNFLYGRMEARIQIPGAQGMWPAFWMIGSDYPTARWPYCGEIDIQESTGADLNSGSSKLYTTGGTLHGPIPGGGNSEDYSLSQAFVASTPLYENYHTYAVEWSPGELDFYVDGTLYERQSPLNLASGDTWEFDQTNNPFFFIIDAAVGGAWPGPPDASTAFPQYMNVDYVRVYQTAQGNLPANWGNYDVGGPSIAGSSTYSGGTYAVAGSGADIWGTSDQFQYTYTPLAGNGQMIAQVASQQDTNSYAKAGVMIRSSRDASSPYALIALTPGSGIQYQGRTTEGGSASLVAGPTNANWVKLVRSGNTITGYTSPDGTTWTELSATTYSSLNSNVLVGLAVSSHDNTQTGTATFSNVSYTNSDAAWDGNPPSLPGFVQFENYDTGGSSVSYSGTFTYQSGGVYRYDRVYIEPTSDYGAAGYDVPAKAGNWLSYTVNAQTTKTYTLNVRVASNGQGGTLHFTADGSTIGGEITIPNTGGAQTWETVSVSGISLAAGVHKIGVVMDTNGASGSVGSFDWFSFQ